MAHYGDFIEVTTGSNEADIEHGAALVAQQMTETVRALLDLKKLSAPLTIQWEIKESHG